MRHYAVTLDVDDDDGLVADGASLTRWLAETISDGLLLDRERVAVTVLYGPTPAGVDPRERAAWVRP